MSESPSADRSPKAQSTRSSLIAAAAALLREEGVQAVTYRKVAQKAGAASSSVGYHFDSLENLRNEAGLFNVKCWADHAQDVADKAENLNPADCQKRLPELLTEAVVPVGFKMPVGFYVQYVAATDTPGMFQAFESCHKAFDAAIARILRHGGATNMPPRMVGILVDGATAAAVAQGIDIRNYATSLLAEMLAVYRQSEGTPEASH